MNQRNSITGLIAAYAGGLAEVVVAGARAPITASGSFSVPVSLNPSTVTLKLSPPPNSPYQPLSLSVTLGPGATDVSAEINGALSIVGTYIGVPGNSAVGANAAGYAVPGSGGGGVPGGTDGQLQYNDSGSFGGAGVTDGEHFAFGVGATVDGADTDFYNAATIVNIQETHTDAASFNGLIAEIEWNPTSNVGAGFCTAFGALNRFNLDGQTDGAGVFLSACENTIESRGNTTLIETVVCSDNIAYNSGTAPIRHFFGCTGTTDSGAGDITEDQIGLLGGVITRGGTVPTIVPIYSDLIGVTGGHVLSAKGVFIAGLQKSGGTVDSLVGLEIADMQGATQNYQIYSVGTSPSLFMGPVSATRFDATTIYSAAGTPLPAASVDLKGSRAVVSDATLPTFLGAYVSGGAVVAPVFCDGTGWVTA